MIRWFHAQLDGSYVGKPGGVSGAPGPRRYRLQVYRAALRDLTWIEAPASEGGAVGSNVEPGAAPGTLWQSQIDHAHLAGVRGPGTWYEGPIFDVRIRDVRLTHPTDNRGRAYGRISGSVVGWLDLPPIAAHVPVAADAIAGPEPALVQSGTVYVASGSAADERRGAESGVQASDAAATADEPLRPGAAHVTSDALRRADVARSDEVRVGAAAGHAGKSGAELTRPDALRSTVDEKPGVSAGTHAASVPHDATHAAAAREHAGAASSDTGSPASPRAHDSAVAETTGGVRVRRFPAQLPFAALLIALGSGLAISSGGLAVALWLLFTVPTLLARRLFGGILRDSGAMRGVGFGLIALQIWCASSVVSNLSASGCATSAFWPALIVVLLLFPTGLLPSVWPLSFGATGLAVVLAAFANLETTHCKGSSQLETTRVQANSAVCVCGVAGRPLIGPAPTSALESGPCARAPRTLSASFSSRGRGSVAVTVAESRSPVSTLRRRSPHDAEVTLDAARDLGSVRG